MNCPNMKCAEFQKKHDTRVPLRPTRKSRKGDRRCNFCGSRFRPGRKRALRMREGIR